MKRKTGKHSTSKANYMCAFLYIQCLCICICWTRLSTPQNKFPKQSIPHGIIRNFRFNYNKSATKECICSCCSFLLFLYIFLKLFQLSPYTSSPWLHFRSMQTEWSFKDRPEPTHMHSNVKIRDYELRAITHTVRVHYYSNTNRW